MVGYKMFLCVYVYSTKPCIIQYSNFTSFSFIIEFLTQIKLLFLREWILNLIIDTIIIKLCKLKIWFNYIIKRDLNLHSLLLQEKVSMHNYFFRLKLSAGVVQPQLEWHWIAYWLVYVTISIWITFKNESAIPCVNNQYFFTDFNSKNNKYMFLYG